MGNYKNFEHDFVDRTLHVIAQYESILHRYDFEQQYNYTLLLNCLLGVIVMPKSRVFSHIPNHRLTAQLKNDMGISKSYLNPKYTRIREFITDLRNSIAHFSIEVESADREFMIDNIVFRDSDGTDTIVANFNAEELLPFIRYYASWIKSNLLENQIK